MRRAEPLNASKTQAILLTFNRNFNVGAPNIILDGTSVPFADSVKDLGLTLTRNLSWNKDEINATASNQGESSKNATYEAFLLQ